MGWIRERIKAEKRKHHDTPFGQAKRDLDWARIAEGKIVMSIMEWAWKNNTIPLTELRNLECECGHSLFHHAEPDVVEKTGGVCVNKFCLCEAFKLKEHNPDLRLAMTDGGWVNCIKLHEYIKGMYNEKKKGCGKKMGNSTCGLTQSWDVTTTTMTTKYCDECKEGNK